jgi:hypothetical protein
VAQPRGGWITVVITVGLGMLVSVQFIVGAAYILGLEPFPSPPWSWPFLAAAVSMVAGCYGVFLRVDGRPMARWGWLCAILATVVWAIILLTR